MPAVSLDINRAGWGGDIQKIEAAIVSLQEYLFWILQVLDSGNIKSINTNATIITSNDKTTHIDGSQLKMHDEDKSLRLVMGYNPKTKNYEFSMYNKTGNETLLIDEDGNAVFAGTVAGSKVIGAQIEGGKITGVEIEGGSIKADTAIDVGTDVTIGETLKLKDGGVTAGTLSIYDGTTPTVLLRGEGSRDVRISTDGSIELSAYKVVNNLGKRFITEGYDKMFVTIGGVNYPVKFS